MFCYKCGKEIKEGDRFCPGCGAAVEPPRTVKQEEKTEATDAELRSAVERFIAGDDSAFEVIYSGSKRYLFYTIYKSVGDRNIAEDVLQETYLEIYKNLTSLRSIDAFRRWAAMVAQSRISRYFNKNREQLFSSEEEMDEKIESEVEDDEDLLPESAVQNRETARLVMEIIDSLNPPQRDAIVAFYYNQMSIMEISQSTGVPENTVKTNLRRGKEKIKTGILELEKKHGTKLYGVLPFSAALLFIFGEDAKACTLPSGVLSKVMAMAAATGTAGSSAIAGMAGTGAATGGTVGAGVSAAAGISIRTLAAIAAVSLAVGGITTAGVLTVTSKKEADGDEWISEEWKDESEEEMKLSKADRERVDAEPEDEEKSKEKDKYTTSSKKAEKPEAESEDEPEDEPEEEPEEQEEESPEEEEPEIDTSKIYGEWTLPGYNRLYMSFSKDGTLDSGEYGTVRFEVEKNKLYIHDTYDGEIVYDIVYLDGSWMGIQREGKSEIEYSVHSADPDSAADNEMDTKLMTDYSEVWVAENAGSLPDECAGGLYFSSDSILEWYIGEPDSGDVWSMAMTNIPGAWSVKNGKIIITDGPGKSTEYKYEISGDGLLHIHYGNGMEVVYVKVKKSYY